MEDSDKPLTWHTWRGINLPNQLTVARFILTMIFLALASVPDHVPSHLIWWKIGLGLAVIAGFTDFLDGYLARKYQMITDFGKLMDPLTDKIFTVSCFVVLTEYHVVPGWITVLILTREFAVTGLRTMAANKGHIMSASFLGKLKTSSQMIVLAVGGAMWVGWVKYPGPDWFQITWLSVLGLIALVTIYSGIEYYVKGSALYLNKMR